MFRLLAPLLGLLILAIPANAQYSVETIRGHVTVISQDSSGPFESCADALTSAFQNDSTGTVSFAAPGSYLFDEPATVSRSRKTLVIPPTVTLTPTGTGSVGIATFSGDYVSITGGGTISVPTAVNDQVILSITGSRANVDGLTFSTTSTSGANLTPVIFLGLTGSQESRVQNNRFIPLRGFTCIKATAGQRNFYGFNNFGPADTSVYEASASGITSANTTTPLLGEVWRCIDLQHDGWAVVQGNRARYLGRGSSPQGDCFLNYDFDSTYYPDDEGGLHEAGHLNFMGNYIEDCSMPVLVRLNGCRWGQIVGNAFANSLGGIVTATEAGLVLDMGDEETVASADSVSVTGTDTYTLASGSWDHTPQNGDKILITGSLTDAANLGWKTVASATSSTIVVTETLVNESAQSTTIISGYPCDDIVISGNQFHNLPFITQAAGGDIYLGYVNRVLITGNQFSNNLGEYSITVEDTDIAQEFYVLSNSFEGKAWFYGTENQPTSPIRTLAGSSGARYVAGGNSVVGYSGAMFTHASGTPTGEVFEDGLQDSNDGDVPDGTTTVAQLTTNVVLTDPP